MSYLGTPEEFEEWLATDQTIPLQEWLMRKRLVEKIKNNPDLIRELDMVAGIPQAGDWEKWSKNISEEMMRKNHEQVQRSDDLREALAGTTIELIGDRTRFNQKIDVVRYDDAGNREVVGEAELNMDGNVVVVKAEVDKDKLRGLLQTEVDRFSQSSSPFLTWPNTDRIPPRPLEELSLKADPFPTTSVFKKVVMDEEERRHLQNLGDQAIEAIRMESERTGLNPEEILKRILDNG